MALDHPDSQDWQQTGSDVLADTLRLAALAEDLLVLARLDEADQPRRRRGMSTWPRWPPTWSAGTRTRRFRW